MRKLFALASTLFALSYPGSTAAEVWMTIDGKSFEASFVRIQGDEAIFARGSKKAPIKIIRLSPRDRHSVLKRPGVSDGKRTREVHAPRSSDEENVKQHMMESGWPEGKAAEFVEELKREDNGFLEKLSRDYKREHSAASIGDLPRKEDFFGEEFARITPQSYQSDLERIYGKVLAATEAGHTQEASRLLQGCQDARFRLGMEKVQSDSKKAMENLTPEMIAALAPRPDIAPARPYMADDSITES